MNGPAIGREDSACGRCVAEASVWMETKPERAQDLLKKALRTHLHLDLVALAEMGS